MKKFFIVTIIIVIAGLTIFFGFYNKDSAKTNPNEPANEEISGETINDLPPVEPEAVFQEPVTYGSLKESYSHANFSFKYSDSFKATANIVEEGEIVTLENSKGSGFQVFISVFDEPGPITPERIWQDQPDMEISDPKNAQLDGTKTLVFNSYDEDMGATFEAWTVRKGKLYQIAGPKTAEKLITETLETWQWIK